MKGKKGFTLIELLMVIAVIAVLMSILIPALGKIRALARNLVCQSNLRQWGYIWDMYTQKNNSLFDMGYRPPTVDTPQSKLYWPWTMRNYYDKAGGGITCCPMAKNPNKNSFRDPDGTWGPSTAADPWTWVPPSPPDYYGSYGQNCCIWNSNYAGAGLHWKRTGHKQSNNIPVFMDCVYVWVLPNMDPQYIPRWENDFEDGNAYQISMKDACINRHKNWQIDVLFMDWSVRKVSLKGLWDLYWYRGWAEERLRRLGLNPPDWPITETWYDWMKGCPDITY